MNESTVSLFPFGRTRYFLLLLLIVVGYSLLSLTGPHIKDKVMLMFHVGLLLSTELVMIPVASVIVALLVALIPYRDLPYSRRYVRGIFVSLFVFNLTALFVACMERIAG